MTQINNDKKEFYKIMFNSVKNNIWKRNKYNEINIDKYLYEAQSCRRKYRRMLIADPTPQNLLIQQEWKDRAIGAINELNRYKLKKIGLKKELKEMDILFIKLWENNYLNI